MSVFFQLSMVFSVGWYTSPVLAAVLYRRGYFAVDGLLTLTKFASGFGLLMVASLIIRAFGRAANPTYVTFLHTLRAAQNDLNKDTKKALMNYDCEFWAWPVCFQWNHSYVYVKFDISLGSYL